MIRLDELRGRFLVRDRGERRADERIKDEIMHKRGNIHSFPDRHHVEL